MFAIATQPDSYRPWHTDALESDPTPRSLDGVKEEPAVKALPDATRVCQSEAQQGLSRFLTALLRALSMPGS